MATVAALPRSARGARQDVGLLLMVLAMMLVPGVDVFGKILTGSMAPGQIAWIRFALQSVALLGIMLATGRGLRSRQLGVHAVRGILLAIGTVLLIWALRYLPIANAIAIFFVEPLLLVLLSGLFLGERIGRRQLTAVAVGLVGTLVVIRPSWSAFGAASLLPLGTAICVAGYLALTRHVAAAEDALRMQFWAGVFAALILSVALLIGHPNGVDVMTATWPTGSEWSLLAALGAVSAVTHVLLALAFTRAPAGTLAPLQYLEIISATILGYLVFGHLPDAMTWAGVTIIIGSGLYVISQERSRPHRQPATANGA